MGYVHYLSFININISLLELLINKTMDLCLPSSHLLGEPTLQEKAQNFINVFNLGLSDNGGNGRGETNSRKKPRRQVPAPGVRLEYNDDHDVSKFQRVMYTPASGSDVHTYIRMYSTTAAPMTTYV